MKADAKGWRDLAAVTGLGRDATKAAIRTGELPGYLVGSRYIVPLDAFTAFCEGRWVPQHRPIFTQEIKPAPKFLHTRKESAA